MNYTLHQLQVFLKVTQTHSITKAAEELFLTQPAVSIQLKNFQQQFDIPLTEIVGRQLYITDFGKEIADAARRILAEVEEIQFRTLAHKGLLAGKLSIAVVSTGKYVMPFFLSDFLQQYPGIELHMEVTNRSQVVTSLQQNTVDFALVSILPNHLDVQFLELMPNQLFWVGKQQPTEIQGNISPATLGQLPLLFREPGSGTRLRMEEFLEDNDLKVRPRLELSSNEAVKQAMLAGLGYSLMPLIGIKHEIINGWLQIVPVEGLPIQSQWNLVWLRNKSLSPVAQAYLSFLRNEKERLIQEQFGWVHDFS